MENKIIVVLLFVGFIAGHFLWPKVEIKTRDYPVISDGQIKKCLDKGGDFYASNHYLNGLGYRCIVPPHEEIIQ